VGRIVVGIDESDCSREALAWALEEARLRQSVLEVVYAYGSTSGWVGMGEVVGAAIPENFSEDDVAHAARSVLNDEVDRATGGPTDVELILRTVPLHAGEALVEASNGATLLVLGTHGHGDLHHALLGSVSSHCIHHARCPVVVVRQNPGGRHPPAAAPTVPVAPADRS
jgi:nucleotide-binding universal stress UspA family protein